jgi:2-aminobenzoate-CoA ligase
MPIERAVHRDVSRLIEIRHSVRENRLFKCPRSFVFLDELPKTATGKIQRFKLRDGDAPSPPGSSS